MSTVQEVLDPLVETFTKRRHLALRDPLAPHGTHQIVPFAGGHASDPGLLDNGGQGPFGEPARLKKRREIAPLPQLGDGKFQGPEPRLQGPFPLAVAVDGSLPAPLVAGRPDPVLDLKFPKLRQRRLRQLPQQVLISALARRLNQIHALLGHRVFRFGLCSRKHNLTGLAR